MTLKTFLVSFAIANLISVQLPKAQSLEDSVQVEQVQEEENSINEINYNIVNPCDVLIRLYNVAGQEIDTLVNCKQTQGNYQIKFDSTYTPGIYFYKIKIGKEEKTDKVVVFIKSKT